MIAEGNETPGGEFGGSEGRSRRSEGDLLAERRAQRAAESGEHALTLRAEAAEATVRTLETHIGSLQQRLREAEEEGRRLSDSIESAQSARAGERLDPGLRSRAPGGDPVLERELQRASQREYAEQRLRMEAEDRAGEAEREARAEIDRLNRRLSAGEREAQALGAQLEESQRELAEARQDAAAERAAALRSERTLRARIGELEHQAAAAQGGLAAEQAARGRAEAVLAGLRGVHRSAQGAVGELADTIARLRDLAAAAPTPEEPPPPVAAATDDEEEEASARVIATAHVLPESPRAARAPAPPEQRGGEMAEALAAAVERLRARAEEQPAAPAAPVVKRAPHKHSMSLITRSRNALRRRRERRKQRREA